MVASASDPSLPEFAAYRHAAWDTPWWVNANRSAGRYNREDAGSTQYLCLHPLGPAAELLRHLGEDVVDDVDTITYRLWAMRVPNDGLKHISFDNATSFGLVPDDLVAEDHSKTQDLGDRLRRTGCKGFIAPSAALPGTEVLVLLGPRVLSPYTLEPIDPTDQIPTGHAAEARIPAEILPLLRWRGRPHAGIDAWRAGHLLTFVDPRVTWL